MGIFVYVKKRMTMVIENKDAIRLVEFLKSSKKLNQKKTSISFNMDGSRCSLFLSWKSKKKKDMYNALYHVSMEHGWSYLNVKKV